MRAWVIATCAVFAVVATALSVLRHHTELHPPLSRAAAVAAAQRDPDVRLFTPADGWTQIATLPLDATHWRVTFFHHARDVLDVSVNPRGVVDSKVVHTPGQRLPGNEILWKRPLLIGLTALLVALLAVAPLRTLRNLDATVLAAGVLLVLVLDHRSFVRWEAWVQSAFLAYLAGRCAWLALRPRAGPQPDQQPVYEIALALLPARTRPSIAKLVTAAAVVAGIWITYKSTGVSDVGFAGMAGATTIQHGQLPYGHLTQDVIHGDTYPLFSYLLYLPFSLASPVATSFDDLQGALDLNAIALALAFVLLYVATRRSALALAWLVCPAVLLAASGGGNDVPAAAFVAAALAAAARPLLATAALAVAGGIKVGPAAALVPWISAMRSRRLAAITIVGGTVALLFLLLVGIGGSDGPAAMLRGLRFQFERGTFHSLWSQGGLRWMQPLCAAAVITFAVIVAVRFSRERDAPSLQRVCAAAGALVAGLQLSANYTTWAYLPWVLPFILVALFSASTPGSACRTARSR